MLFHFPGASGICRDARLDVGRIANPTYGVPSDVLVYHDDSNEPFLVIASSGYTLLATLAPHMIC